MRRRLLFLSHCLPWPPDKGERIRAWHVLNHLSRDYDIHLGCVVPDKAALAHVPRLRELCAEVAAFPINRRLHMLRALVSARPGRPLMPDFYFSPALKAWVDRALAGHHFDTLYIYTVAMAPHVTHRAPPPTVLDAVDIDSEKWAEYAAKSRFPMRAVWAREARNLLAYEREAASCSAQTLFVSQAEASRFLALAPELAGRVDYVENGVDLDRFSPALPFVSPFTHGGPNLVFTGHMDYWPNQDAAAWFAHEVLPLVRRSAPDASFCIVGANPSPAVLRLAHLPGVVVTGRVDDTRPYIAHAEICVCPLRMARGIQNKLLEAASMGRPVVASPAAFQGIRAAPGRDMVVAETATAFAAACLDVMAGVYPGLGGAARTAMEASYGWDATLARLDDIIEVADRRRPPANADQ
jgi:sugar transferase (PEP-CTERM/EpsH1 system associated)